MSRRALFVVAVVVALVAALVPPASATFPFPTGVPGDVYDYRRFKIDVGDCPQPPLLPGQRGLPSNFDCKDDFKLTSYAAQPGDPDYDPTVALNPQELYGVKGSSTNEAWEVTTGRPDTVIAVTDSGIRWDEDRTNLVNKFFLNRGELPRPNSATKGGTVQQFDANGDGVFNVKDYAADARAVDLPDDANAFLDPSDLIRTFSDGVDDDGNGYVDDISGWDFFEGDNDPNDDVDYGHGTGESEDSAGETETNLDPQCPNCMLMEMRVGDSFVADVNHFAEAVIYATDNGASVIQSALGTLNNTAFAQRAADYAYERGVLFMASEADESAGHHNMPSALNHTLLANSVTHAVDLLNPIPVQVPNTYLAFNGCTNFGSYSWISVASTSCSSDAIGQSSGIAGLIYSAARNAVQNGVIDQRSDTAGRPLSAEEAKQLFRLGADDIDFSTAKAPFPPNNFVTTLPDSQRFVTTADWDQVSGWGRINADKAVRLVAAGTIPPEADIVSPRWWQTLPVTGSVAVQGAAAAPRLESGAFTYQVQFAPGVQGGCPGGCATLSPVAAADRWTTVFTSAPRTAPIEGTLATLDMAAVKAAIDQNNLLTPAYNPANDPTSRELPEKDAFRVRVLTCEGTCPADPDYDPKVAIEQRQYFARSDGTILPGWPKFLDGDGAGSATFDDLDGDNVDEMVIADGNGLVHAYKANGTEAPGWPVHTLPIALPTAGTNAYGRGEIATPVYGAILTGTPAIADLDGDGSPEISAGDIEGNLYVWGANGTPRPGFPVRGNPAYSEEPGCHEGARPACDDYSANDVRDVLNNVDRGFTAHPAAADLDPSSPGLELVAGSNDGHVYAFRADGTPVPGWPVLLRDPTKVQSVDPVTHKVRYVDGTARFGRKVISTPSVGDVDGDGDLEVAVNVNEEYEETPNVSPARALSLQALAVVNPPGNTRTYLLHHDGTNHAKTPDQVASAHPDDQAYVAGWPVRIAMAVLELLPYVGEGSDGSPVLADVDDDGALEILTASIAGPPYALRNDGTSVYPSGPDGSFTTMAIEKAEAPTSVQTDFPAIAALGGGVVGRLAPNAPLSFAMGAAGLKRLLDVVLPEQQLLAEDHLAAWNTTTGSFEPGFPALMNDLQFFNTPAIADVTGDGLAEVLQSSAMYDLRAYGAGGLAPPLDWPKFTGGWSVATPGTGDLNGDGLLDVALPTREGNLFVWGTEGDACQAQEWPKFQGNLRNTGAYGVDAKRPGKPTIVSIDPLGTLLARPSGDDGVCGTATSYRVRVDGVDVNGEPAPASPGTLQLIEVGKLPAKFLTITVQTIDDAGNVSFPATLGIDNRPPGSGGTVGTAPSGSGSGSGAGGGAGAGAAGSSSGRPAYRMVATDGGIFTFGGASFEGSTGDLRLNKPIVGMAQTPSKRGYWLGASDGGIFTFGDAVFHGSAGALPLNKPIVGVAVTPNGGGYWLVASDGGIFTFGNAGFFGSTGDLRLNQPIVGMAPTPTGRGYWLVAADGGIFSFGDASFFGSTGDLKLNKPIVGIAATPFGKGYRFVATDGGIFAFGDAGFFGSTGSLRLNQPIVGMENTVTGAGYWLVAADGGVFTFGDAAFLGSTGDIRLNKPIVGIDGG